MPTRQPRFWSRSSLTISSTANAGELDFRGDAKWGFFVKGFVGAGGISGGRLTDADFPFPGFPYSVTTSTASGTLSYGTVDLGYSVVRQPGFRLGGFVGYGRWNEAITASGLYTNRGQSVRLPGPGAGIRCGRQGDR